MLTPEQMQIARRLSDIFMPYATKQRQRLFNDPNENQNPTARFVHYTSAEAGLKIIRSKRLWMRNATCMADYREVQHGFDMFRNFFSKNGKEAAFIEALDACAPGAATEAINFFNHWSNDIRFNTYITSISEHDPQEDLHGRLSMWRAFGGGNTARVGIVFEIPWATDTGSDLHVMVSPVGYLSQLYVNEMLESVINNIQSNCEYLRNLPRARIISIVFNMLMAGVVCCKHEGFREEREWRAMYAPKRWPSKLIESSTEIVAGIPQIVHKIPLEGEFDLTRILDRVILGPSPYPAVMFDAFVAALSDTGLSDAGKRVFASDIPIRSP